MKKLLLILLCLPMIGFGQQTYVPDDVFEQILEQQGWGNGIPNDNYVFTDSINNKYGLNLVSFTGWCLPYYTIKDLTGIEDFTAMTHFYCSVDSITTIDLSGSPDLFRVNFFNCKTLTSINLSNNLRLKELYIERLEMLTNLSISNLDSLTELELKYTPISNLDLSNYNFLKRIEIDNNNNLTELDVSNNSLLENVKVRGNDNLNCFDISNNSEVDNIHITGDGFEILTGRLLLDNGNNSNMSGILTKEAGCYRVDGFPSNQTWLGLSSLSQVINTSICAPNSGPCNSVSAIQEHTTNKELLKVTDLLGRKTKQTNQPLFYIYDDGTVEKRIVIEQ